MEKLILLAVLLCGSFIISAQSLIINDAALKTGIYKNFEEFKYNDPSMKFNYEISVKKRRLGFLNSKKLISSYRIDIDKKEAKAIGKVFGFCDGENIYINESSPKLKPKTEFYRVEYLGKYCYFESRDCTTTYTGNVPNESCYLSMKVVDLSTGEVIRLTKKSLKEILADDIELLTEFNNEPRQKKKIKAYILRYLEKNNSV